MRTLPVACLLILGACEASNENDTSGSDSIPGEYYDRDDDGYDERTDCDDDNAAVHPGADEICDGIDNDCDDLVDDEDSDVTGGTTWYLDADHDGYGLDASAREACEQPEGWVDRGGDCDDEDARFHPGADESDCTDPNDYNCDGYVGYADNDDDGYAACEECNDDDPAVHPGATEYCNGYDDDCDGQIDEGDAADAPTWYADTDGDGYGDPENTTTACDQPEGYVADDTDCDDADSDSHPMGTEVCDDRDNDCDGSVDEDAVDAPTWYRDADGDGYGTSGTSLVDCTQPRGYVDNSDDCDDTDATTYPGADEVCDGVDNDCNGRTDDDPVDGAWYYADEDGDTFGDALETEWGCSGATNDWDCNDSDASEPQVVDASAASTRPDGTAERPWTTIQEGIDAADQCVVVYAGTYYEALQLVGTDITITGVEGSTTTVVDASGHGLPALTVDRGEGAATTIRGFTLTSGEGHLDVDSTSYGCGCGEVCTDWYYTYCGGGVYVSDASPTLQDLIVRDNTLPEASVVGMGSETTYTWSFGGGLCLLGTDTAMTGVEVWGNEADQGGGLYVDESSSVSFQQGRIVANRATDGAGWGVDGGVVELENVLSAWNTATQSGGGALVVDGLFTAVNVTHGGDDAPVGAGLHLDGTSTGSVMNTIIWGAATGEGVYGDSTATFSGLYNDVYGNAGGEYSGVTNPTGTSGNISWNPSFADVTDDGDPTDDDWTLTSSSICVDAGNPSSAYYDTDGSRNDMGAYGGPGGAW